MLRIEIPSNGSQELFFNELEKYTIPHPPNGFNSEINNNVVIDFENEQEALDYSYELDAYSNSIDAGSPEYRIITAIIKAIGDDDFVQAYIQD
jgi:hypothetical protein